MNRPGLAFMFENPGGWPRGLTFDEEVAARRAAYDASRRFSGPPEVVKTKLILVLLLFLAVPLIGGFGFAWRVHSLWVIALGFLFVGWVLRNAMLKGVPAKTACAWPSNPDGDKWRSYIDLMVTVTVVWLMSLAIFVQCVMTMQYGMGDEWNPFTRSIRLTKGGPYSGYGLVQMIMFVSGFFAVTGFLWWPMYAFFEWLGYSKRIVARESGTHA
jgi:hypothetical protein